MNFLMFKLVLEKAKEPEINVCWIIKKAREFQKNIYFCLIDYTNAFDCVDNNKLWKILKEMGIPGHLTCLLRNLHADQEATVRTGHGTTASSPASLLSSHLWQQMRKEGGRCREKSTEPGFRRFHVAHGNDLEQSISPLHSHTKALTAGAPCFLLLLNVNMCVC